MRFDNPIKDHGFTFPDIADFPDVKNEKRYMGNGDVTMLYEAVQKKDLNMFEKGYKSYMKIEDKKLFEKINYMFNFYNNFKNNRKPNSLSPNKVYDDLFENGISYLSVDTKELNQKLKQEIDTLLEQPDWRPPPGQFDRAKQLGSEYIKIITDLFQRLGVLQGATKYNKNNPLQVKNVVLHIATPTDENWKQFLYDCNTITRTTNYHIDPKEDVIKAMLYLNNITEDDGPFSYVEKSNRWIYDDLQNIFGRAISTGSYCHNPESRAVVFQLPKKLRISHNFGRVLLDSDPQQQMVLDKQTIFTSDKGNLCIFDPAGMHRGGICNKGNRIALQILMK